MSYISSLTTKIFERLCVYLCLNLCVYLYVHRCVFLCGAIIAKKLNEKRGELT